MSAQSHLTQSSAGIRLIALLTLYNQGSFDRLRAYIADNFAPAALAEVNADARLADWRDHHTRLGKLRVVQVAAVGKVRAVVVVQSQQNSQYHALQVAVEDDFPHRVTQAAWGDVGLTRQDEIT